MVGLANLASLELDEKVWIWFISVWAVSAKILLFLGEYLLFRHLVRRRLRVQPA
jgi:hypothetical protein